MMYLIVPPIIIMLAIAILIVFLTRVLSSGTGANSSVVFTDKSDTTSGLKRSGTFLKNTGTATTQRIKKTWRSTNVAGVHKKYNGDSIMTQGNTSDENIDNVVSLRKKSMISDKINNGEARDEAELKMMEEIENDPQNSKNYERLGDYYMEQEKFEDARDCYKYVLRLDPRHKRAQVAMRNLDRVL
ncbi:MAG: tetratricopeptide repeat protein [Patescibacteria group bacterium]|nr:tetratricopeptide repeat protein [Patescibacteria group bacterium]